MNRQASTVVVPNAFGSLFCSDANRDSSPTDVLSSVMLLIPVAFPGLARVLHCIHLA